ncbi:unnamed protein product [Closterium sp. Yama58-4]|nr:unnamed protein product [Closterium sp. Yama58-4]
MDSSRLSPTSPLTPDRSWTHPCSVKNASPFDLSAPSHSHETPLQKENRSVNPESSDLDHHVSNAFPSTPSEQSQTEFRAAAKNSTISRLWGGASAAATALPACGRQGCGVDGPARISRPLTGDEELWWRAMHGGTGVCVVGLQISGHVSIDEVRAAIETLSARHPVLSARIIKPPKAHRPELHVCRPPQPITVRERDTADVATSDDSDCQKGLLHCVVEIELNTPMIDGQDQPKTTTSNGDKGEACVDVFQVHVYASHSSTLVALRSHIAALDEHSAPPIAAEFLEELRRALSAKSTSVKGTFAQAFNAVGYVRNALISSHLPFEHGRADSRKNTFTTRFVTVTFTKEETAALLAAAESHGCSLFSLECAAGLKAAARMKQLGGRTEIFSLGSAIGCRTILDPPLPQTALGEYMSMLPLKQEVSEKLPLWDVATSISAHAESALQRQQQFTDMPVLELLFSTAMKMPSLSPDHSLRTCFITAGMLAPLKVDWQLSKPDAEADVEARAEATHLTGMGSEPVQLEQVLGPVVSAHGVGPAIAIPDTLSEGILRLSFVFVTPLFTRERMATFAALTRDFMLEAARL